MKTKIVLFSILVLCIAVSSTFAIEEEPVTLPTNTKFTVPFGHGRATVVSETGGFIADCSGSYCIGQNFQGGSQVMRLRTSDRSITKFELLISSAYQGQVVNFPIGYVTFDPGYVWLIDTYGNHGPTPIGSWTLTIAGSVNHFD